MARPVHKQIHPHFRLAAVVLASLLFSSFSEQRLHAAVSGTWTGGDVGAPVVKGSAQQATCATATACPLFTVTGAGLGIGGTSDQFMYLFQKLTGDGAITMRLQSLAGTLTTEAGLMMRESLLGTARHVSILTIGGGASYNVRTRSAAGGSTTSTAVSRGSWLRLERVGPTITAWISSDGAQWTLAGTQTLTLPATIYAGIVVSSRVATTMATASVSNMSVVSTTPTLPQGWSSADVGPAPSAGTASYTNGSFIGASAGAGLAASQDGFRFIYTRVRGDAKLVAQVVASEGRVGRQAGIVLRSTLDAGAMELALVVDDAGVVLVRRAGALQAATKTRLVSNVAPVYLQLDRKGSMIAVAYSTDGTTWRTVANSSMAFGTEIYAGLGVAAGPSGGFAAAAFDRLSLVSVAANAAPLVSLTAPSTGSIVTQGKVVTLSATASDPDDLVARVDFSVNGVKVATDSSAPYSASWTAGTAGLYSIVASAADFDGAVTASVPSLVTVSAPVLEGGSSSSPPPPSGPWRLLFTASLDHATIDHYELLVYDAVTRLVMVSRSVGKPVPAADGTCTVDVDAFIGALPAGFYEGVVRAVSPSGIGASPAYSFGK